jgi:hypothetical protein
MGENPIRWKTIYLGLMISLIVMIALFYWLTVAYA